MPRNGSGVYSLPAGTDDMTPNTTIESSKQDSLTADLKDTLNTAWPRSLGGTGGTDTAAWIVPVGTVLLPGLAFAGDTNTGFYQIGADNWGFAAAGAKLLDFSAGQMLVQLADNGATVGPVLDLFRDSASPAASDILGKLIFNGRDSAGNKQEYASIEAIVVDPTTTSEDGELDVYLLVAGTRTKIGAVTLSGWAGPNGTVALPALSFISDPDTGIYRIGANNIGVAVNGAKVLDVATNAVGVSGTAPVLAVNKAASAQVASIQGQTGGVARWNLVLGNATAESGSNVGSDLVVQALDDAGAFLSNPIVISRSSGLITLGKGQLAFPATQNPSSDANTLDDYEEGSTTPTPTSEIGTFTSVSAALHYTKIGRRVFCDAKITVTTLGTADGAFRIPLPFTNGGLEGHGGGIITATGIGLSVWVLTSGTVVNIMKSNGTTPGATCEVTFAYDIS